MVYLLLLEKVLHYARTNVAERYHAEAEESPHTDSSVSDEAKTWTHQCRLHGANVLSHSDDTVVPTKAISVCANH